MKNWLTQALAGLFAIATLSLASCEKDEVKATLKPNSTPTLTASTNTVALLQANSAQTAVTYTWTPITAFTWSEVEHPYNPTVTYNIQVDKQGNNFAAPVSIGAGAGPTTVLTVDALNSSLTTLGLTPGTATPLEVRLQASYAANSPLFSPTVPLTATIYKACVPPNADTWSIIGPAGVDWDTDVQLTYNCDLKAYTITRALKAGAFKFRLNKAWTTSYGSTSTRNSSGTAPIDTNPGNDIMVTTAGTYTIILDLNNKTYSLKQ
ncbi:SusE domain-containing protein [Hymenobacter sp. GOD-10R]|uniref:SusE domain-containing protein n=1 Tax=Hymenobacter sp. GOD-10R TaxID=3093922 RepID=UPI002D7763B4|nr:SusE domain-containing protein [Hymenobacter sp. GOD-10R]WRQ26788.1 SusE domain-containing protein [Hymenobacter sp. GOD-10R]